MQVVRPTHQDGVLPVATAGVANTVDPGGWRAVALARQTIERPEEGVKPLPPRFDPLVSPMAMRWDPLVTAALARELEDRLERVRLRAFLLDEKSRRALFWFREGTLVLEMHPSAGWISWLEASEPLPGARPLASRLVSARALPDESALVLGFQRVRGRDEGVEVMVEWVGNRWNLAVVGYRSRVIRHVLVSRVERSRSLTVGAPYEPPPGTGREGVEGDLTRGRWDTILEESGSDPATRRRTLVQSVAWTSSLNADRFLEADGYEAWRRALTPETWSSLLLETSRGLQPYPVSLSPHPERHVDGLLEAVGEARAAQEEDPSRTLLLPPGLLDRARKQLGSLEGRARGMARELDKARDPAPLRAMGDLILARYHQIPRGTDRVTLVDFEGEEVEVELDPTLPPNENAERFYKEASRVERARSELPRRIETARKKAALWRDRVKGLEGGTEDPAEIARLLGPDGSAPTGGQQAPSLPYRSFQSSLGREIRVGRGAKGNDELTFHHSSPEDIWLHVRQAPGAHVILRWQSREAPPRQDLLEAAILAALNSEARHSGSVPVDWTRRKHVRKPRKAPPGAVTPGQVQTVFVEPDPTLPQRLSGSE
jgi:predicted ribosome quality control (RQC) complex YloA/Tae2 family protein